VLINDFDDLKGPPLPTMLSSNDPVLDLNIIGMYSLLSMLIGSSDWVPCDVFPGVEVIRERLNDFSTSGI
jgi:hypothetical protein